MNFQFSNVKRILVMTWMAAAVLSSCRDAQWDKHAQLTEQVSDNLLELIKANPEWSTFHQVLVKTGQDELLTQTTNFTVFVPYGSAWPASLTNSDNADSVAKLTRLVRNHIAYNKVLMSDIRKNEVLYMTNDKVGRYNSQQNTINGAEITSPDIVAANGVLHATNKLLDMRNNVWETALGLRTNSLLRTMTGYLTRGDYEMDTERSVFLGLDSLAQEVYDIEWVWVYDFLREIPLNDELQEYTFILLESSGFGALHNRYRPYLRRNTTLSIENDTLSDALAGLHVCRDMVFKGSIDVQAAKNNGDTLTSITGVKVVLSGLVKNSYDASNGKVYVLDGVAVPMRSKIKPVLIEGENFENAYNKSYIYTRYRPERSGEKDILLACSTVQSDTLVHHTTGVRDSIVSTTFYYDNSYLVNATNFWIEYKAEVFSTDYEIHYMACNDIENHLAGGRGPAAMRLEQKLFISRPDTVQLTMGAQAATFQASWIANNYLGNLQCFAGVDTAGIFKERKMSRWNLTDNAGQTLRNPVQGSGATRFNPLRAGTATMRLCNTPRLNGNALPKGTESGMLFLDYIRLEPILKVGDE